MNLGTSQEEVDALFDECDLNGNGDVDIAELKVMFNTVLNVVGWRDSAGVRVRMQQM